MTNLLVTGSCGQLGSEIRELSTDYSNYNFFFCDFNELDITNYQQVGDFINNNKIKIIINCAAYTDVENAEKNQDLANEVNHLSVLNFAKIAKKNKIKLIHISTDYVFDGLSKNEYYENDKTNPQSFYGKSKLNGEIAMKKINPQNSIIIRSSWIYSSFGKNFVKSILAKQKTHDKIEVVNDQIGTPTYARDLAKVILCIISKLNNKKVEIYHYSNNGQCTWYQLAKEIFLIKKININIIPIKTRNYKSTVKRPAFSVLNNDKIKRVYELNTFDWKKSLRKALKEF